MTAGGISPLAVSFINLFFIYFIFYQCFPYVKNEIKKERFCMYCNVCTGALMGIYAYMVQAEVDVSTGLPGFEMVGYLAGEVKEARERVKVALKNVGIDLPPMRITVNLSPADKRKDGTGFDLPIAVGILGALNHVPLSKWKDTLFIGELGLNGEIKRVKGILPILQNAYQEGVRTCIVPTDNAREGGVVQGLKVVGVDNVSTLIKYLNAPAQTQDTIVPPTRLSPEQILNEQLLLQEKLDFEDILGQFAVKRAAEVSAAGFHNMLILGPPGTGKTMVGKRMPSILPPMTLQESLEVSNIYSVQGLLGPDKALVATRPFVQPHHTISYQALVGGGRVPKPGAVSLSHRGVLFLDEFSEFPKPLLDVLRQPLEDKRVTLSRAYGSFTYPADFILIAAMNPCPCGYYPDLNRCSCSETTVRRYLSHISGPILDRIDLCVEAPSISLDLLGQLGKGESSAQIRTRVMKARVMQERRFSGTNYQFNSQIAPRDMKKYCALKMEDETMLSALLQKQGASARTYHRVLKVARTIADLEGQEQIAKGHIMEALAFRLGEEKYWKGMV